MSAYVFAVGHCSILDSFLVACMTSRLIILALICWRASRIFVFSGAGVGIDSGVGAFVFICSYACPCQILNVSITCRECAENVHCVENV